MGKSRIPFVVVAEMRLYLFTETRRSDTVSNMIPDTKNGKGQTTLGKIAPDD